MTGSRRPSQKLGNFARGIILSLCVVVFDQTSKFFIIEILADPPRVIPVTPFFNLALGFNRGVSFGLLGDLGPRGPLILSLLAVAIVGYFLYWLWKTKSFLESTGISLIIGGAVGNVVDRVRTGAVTDFLDFFVGSYHWPAFNLADAGIVAGAAIIIVRPFFDSQRGN